ncbi:MAG: glycosyl transferase, partial [Clostridiales bacterium]|nr:glycosyl transferase [Clostridiales bacterium]
YTCVPFAEEGKCDYCIIPSKRLTGEYAKYGIAEDKLLPFGIPVREQFRTHPGRDEAVRRLGLDTNRRYYMLMGGSIGAGNLRKYGRRIAKYMRLHEEVDLIFICGNNEKLYRQVKREINGSPRVLLLRHTDKVSDCMAASDVLISKPGGLSSTEAAVLGVPLIHIRPIPGCESKNRKFFSETGMSMTAQTGKQLFKALDKCRDERVKAEMLNAQRREINPGAAEEIVELALQTSGNIA